MLKAPTIVKNWKYYTGMTFLVLSLVFPTLGFVVPSLKLPVGVSAVIIAFLTVGGPEVMVILGAVFLGKKVTLYYKMKVLKLFKRKGPPKPVSKERYYFGIFLLLASVLPLYFNAYIPEWMPQDKQLKYFTLISADFVFVISFFILGGEFWEKSKRLFIWDDPKKSRH